VKVRVLIEQRPHPGLGRGGLPSGAIVDIESKWAAELLDRGDAEAVEAEAPAKRAEKRPGPPTTEKR
jgi:hypothetical protein